MDILNSYAENIIKRNINTYGKLIEFKRPLLNKYGEVTDKFEITVSQKCIYHVANDNSSLNSIQGDQGKTVNLRLDMLLTVSNDNIKTGDYCNIGEKFFRVYDVNNYNQSKKIIDIFLEEVQHEHNTGIRDDV